MTISLTNQLGGADATESTGRLTSPPYDENAMGFAGNFTLTDPSGEIYPRRFMVRGEEIESAVRDPLSGEALATYDVSIPNETLEITVT